MADPMIPLVAELEGQCNRSITSFIYGARQKILGELMEGCASLTPSKLGRTQLLSNQHGIENKNCIQSIKYQEPISHLCFLSEIIAGTNGRRGSWRNLQTHQSMGSWGSKRQTSHGNWWTLRVPSIWGLFPSANLSPKFLLKQGLQYMGPWRLNGVYCWFDLQLFKFRRKIWWISGKKGIKQREYVKPRPIIYPNI